VSGLNVATVTVSVRLTDQDGVDQTGDPGSFLPTPLLRVEHVVSNPPGGDNQLVFLSLASGTIYDGWWQGDVYVRSLYNGQVRVAFVEAFDKQANGLQADPASSGFDPRLTVTGTDLPALSAGFSPRIIPYPNSAAFKGRLVHSATGAPYAGISITIYGPALDECCLVIKTTTTDSNGYWGVALTNNQIPDFIDAAVAGPSGSVDKNFFIVDRGLRPRMWWRVWAKSTSSRIRLGSTTTVYGSVAPAGVLTHIAYLQRLVSGTWKTVTQAQIHSSGRFYLTAHPPSRGYQRYRVLIPASQVFIPTATPTLTIYVY
jgi:hypothetical protein